MVTQDGTTTLKKEKDQSLLKQNVQENLSETQGLPNISPPITYEMMEETETQEAAVFRDFMENLELWKSLTNREAMQRIKKIHDEAAQELKEQNQA